MEQFDRISIQEISKTDMLMIIKALEYTGENTSIPSFISLKNSIVKQLSELAETSEDEFLLYLQQK